LPGSTSVTPSGETLCGGTLEPIVHRPEEKNMRQLIAVLCLVAFVGVTSAQEKTAPAKKDTTAAVKSAQGGCCEKCACCEKCSSKCGKKMGHGPQMKSGAKMGECPHMKSEAKTDSSAQKSPESKAK
jgi:hypothetical protein